MAVLSLPLTFTNSFWSQDYRKGLEVLYGKLEHGVTENDEIVAFIRARADAEDAIAASLMSPSATGNKGTGFDTDDGASLLMAFRCLQAESVNQGTAHRQVAKELNDLVAGPFEEWAVGHRERIKQSKQNLLEGWLRAYEREQGEVAKLKTQYLTKMRKSDEAEDDARFAPTSQFNDKYTTSPRLGPQTGRAPPQRTASVSERIAQRLKEIQNKSRGTPAVPEEKEPQEPTEPVEKVDKGKGKATEETASPPAMSPVLPPKVTLPSPPSSPTPAANAPPPPILLAGLSFSPAALSALLTKAQDQIALRPVRFPLLGEYEKCFHGEEFVEWLRVNVEGWAGDWDKADEGARGLCEDLGLMRRVGELGNAWESTDEAWYQFRPKSPSSATATSPSANLAPVADNLLKRSGTFVNLVQRAITNSSSTLLASTGAGAEPPFVKLKAEAEAAEKGYRVGVRRLDRQRLGLEEMVEETLKGLQRMEGDRLRAVKTVLLQYQGTLSNLPQSLSTSLELSSTVIASYQPESDLQALIERYRTGPFRPNPHVWESVGAGIGGYAEGEMDTVFGIDLRKWAEGVGDVQGGEGEVPKVPGVLTALLGALGEKYGTMSNDAEKRKTWIYEVPLAAVHHLRESINGIPPTQTLPAELFEKHDAPILASTVKLWMLELDPPLGLWEGWDDIRKIYPTVGQSVNGEASEEQKEQRIQELGSALQKLPRVHLFVLDAVVSHLRNLIDNTTTEEANEIYTTKLALSIGRSVVRPKVETEMSIQDRHPTLLFMDLVNHYAEILPPTIARKKRESERKVPLRKRTAPIDMRQSRSRISVGADLRAQLAAQERSGKPVPSGGNETVSSPSVVSEPESMALDATSPAVAVAPVPAPAPAPVVPPPPPVLAAPQPVKPITVATPTAPPVAKPNNAPGRPVFRSPPPETNNFPPRPSFKEPPPENEMPSRPPRFASPPPEDEVAPSPVIQAAQPAATSPRVASPGSGGSRGSGAQSPNAGYLAEETLGTKASLARSTSSEAARVRGPRLTRGPRAPGGPTAPAGGGVSAMISNLNRNSISGGVPGSPTSPAYRPGRVGSPTGVGRRDSVRRSGAFSRRTMESDAEENVVSK
ncbi:hypothetical protein JAAARDRAFT_123616 [Jaapia argillacea MUCL 33604]|uniref:Rho-GAP domain-containing protein n=1 Tax=Jaapia argillacea MUCL 33604 TaxID=933084 RepID=A0A067QGP4_9AGAM|nr:hypothetical protein JAAARDRAFT_123616 [Jaapia argillacea MUCL 33604]